MLKVEIVSQVSAERRRQWESLWRSLPGSIPFLHPSWALEASPRAGARYLFASSGNELKLVAPLVRRKGKLKLVGGDYEDVLCSPGLDGSDLAQALAEALGGALFEARHVPAGSPLLSLNPPSGFRSENLPHSAFPALRIPTDFGEIEKFLGKEFWSTTSRKERKRARELPGYIVRESDGSTLDADLAQLYALHQQRQEAKGNQGIFATAAEREGFGAFARAMLAEGRLHLYTMLCDEGPLASFCCLRTRKTVGYYTGGFNDQFAKHSPSHGLILRAAQDCVSRGDEYLDFMLGDEEYKQRWCNASLPTSRVLLYRRFGFGALQALALRLSKSGRPH